MGFLCESLLLGSGLVLNSARPAVVRYVIGIGHDVLLHNRLVYIGGMDDSHIHLRDRGVVGKVVATPLAAGKADSAEAEAVVDATVVAYVPAPIPIVESILSPCESPVGRRPQSALIGSRHPRAGNPEVVSVVL